MFFLKYKFKCMVSIIDQSKSIFVISNRRNKSVCKHPVLFNEIRKQMKDKMLDSLIKQATF